MGPFLLPFDLLNFDILRASVGSSSRKTFDFSRLKMGSFYEVKSAASSMRGFSSLVNSLQRMFSAFSKEMLGVSSQTSSPKSRSPH